MSAASIRDQGAGVVLVISAPSGTGKSSVVRRIGGLRFSISYTTRARRDDEEDGVDYHFVELERFHEMRERGEFLEWAEVHGHCYGTASAVVQAILDAGDDVLLDVDVAGAASLRQALPGAILVFLLPPSYEKLRARLEGRGTAAPDLSRRLCNARAEMEQARTFDYLVVNDVLEEATAALEAIILAERSRRERQMAAWERSFGTFPEAGD
ncbi:MAG: guanylate kinase [Acidobacteria bacterium]|nr:MAG: guanylate kinase [Acidobacteriota bacterium]